VDGYKGAVFKAFDSQHEAMAFANATTSCSAPVSQGNSSTSAPATHLLSCALGLAKNELIGQSAIDFLARNKRSREDDTAPLQCGALPCHRALPRSIDSDALVARSFTDGIGARLLERSGWNGGGLGAQENGILNPINPIVPSGKRRGLGSLDNEALLSVEQHASPRLSSYC
jgi:hypothetical protein